MTGSKGVRLKLESLNKPLLAVLVTHAHPDHYAGLKQVVASDQVPIVAAEGVDKIIRRDDALKNQIIGPMVGEEWPTERIFPNQTRRNGESVTFDGLTFTLIDLGPGESPHDSIWKLEGDEEILFAGDLAYHHMHSYLLDGFYEDWLRNIQRISAEYANAKFYIGHGDAPVSREILEWQRSYINTFVAAVKSAKGRNMEAIREEVKAKMHAFLPTEALYFLTDLSVEPMRKILRKEMK
jgi:glyoxylase-like metal-dependent hydrolase (beta-lactamase superfamily II)